MRGSSQAPCASSSFGVGSADLNIDGAAATEGSDAAAGLDADIIADKSTGSTLSRSIGVEVSGCSDSLRLG